MADSDVYPKARRRVAAYWIVGLGLVLGYAVTRGSTWIGSAQLHTVMEAVATLLAMIVGAMALVRFYAKKNNTFLFIGTGFLGTAFLDGYHAIVTSAFFKPFMPSDLPALIPWSWVASRQFLSILMFLSVLAWLREQKLGEAGRVSEKAVYVFTALFTLASFLFFAFVPLPRAYYPEIIFHRPEEFLPALFFALALVGYLRKGEWRRDAFEHWLVLSLVIGLVSQAGFMSFSGGLFDFEFDAAHTLKKVTYVCVLVGLMINMYAIFRRAEESAESLTAANRTLQAEVTERKRAELALTHRARELARSNEELEQFASVASHDLQEPLRKVQAFGDRLESEYAEALDERGRDYLARMHSAAARMQSLIDSLLMFSRVTTKGQSFTPVKLTAVATEVVSDLEVAIQSSGAIVEIGEMPTIDADPLQIRQLFQNLIGNGIKYHNGHDAPFVKVTAEILDNGDASMHQLCKITVEDNGIGFEEQYAERIFGIFQRLHGRDDYEGTGVGLSICRKICDRHGGDIAAHGRPGEGATFIATLPVVQSKQE